MFLILYPESCEEPIPNFDQHQIFLSLKKHQLITKWYASWWFQNIFYVHPYLGKWSNLTNIFQMGWNHQLVEFGIFTHVTWWC